MKVKGVNLGNWLVLEKWMSPSLFYGTTAEDEYYLPTQLSAKEYEARIKIHRAEYITERDFTRIKAAGMNAVRIPVPYFIFGDRKPFIGCVAELDQAFEWAEKHGLQILIDLHTAPDSQNGFDNGGISGVCKWSKEPEEVEFELTVLERLAKRYGTRSGLWGIEILNEPVVEETWDLMKITERYVAADPEKAQGTGPNTMKFIRNFYLEAYDRIRRYLPEEKYVVFHDAFCLKAWKDFMREEKYKNVVLDTHQYLMGMEKKSVDEYIAYIADVKKDIEEMQQYFSVICGEWCLSNALAPTYEDAEQQKEIYQKIGKAELDAWSAGSGSFFWSYKLLTDTEKSPGWDFGRCIDFGWMPQKNG